MLLSPTKAQTAMFGEAEDSSILVLPPTKKTAMFGEAENSSIMVLPPTKKTAMFGLEAELHVPPDRIWKLFKDMKDAALKSGFVLSYDYLEGDGEVGSVRAVQFNPTSALKRGCYSKDRITYIDDATRTLSYEMLEGELLQHYDKFEGTFSFIEDANASDGLGTLAKWSVKYAPEENAPPEGPKEGVGGMLKFFEAYLIQNPDEYA